MFLSVIRASAESAGSDLLAESRALTKGTHMGSARTERGFALRRLAGIGAALAASLSLLGLMSSPAAAAVRPLPTPTKVVVTQLTPQSFALNIGGTTPKLYSVFINGQITISIVQSSSTISIPVRGLTQNTDYTVRVQEILLPSGRTSPLSAPILVHTPAFVAPVRPNAPTNLRASAVTAESATLSWDASTTSGVTYRFYLNGAFRETTSATSLFVGPLFGFPNPIPSSGLRPGSANRLGVEAVNSAGVASALAELIVTTPGTAANAPTAPTNLRVSSVTNDRINVLWNPSTDSQFTETQLAYRLFLDGRFVGYTCSQYCFGSTSGSAGQLAPGTTYRIGIEAINPNGAISNVTEIVATTSAP